MQRQCNTHTHTHCQRRAESGRGNHKSASTDRSTRFLHEKAARESACERVSLSGCNSGVCLRRCLTLSLNLLRALNEAYALAVSLVGKQCVRVLHCFTQAAAV